MSCPGYNGKKRDRHDWRLIGIGSKHDTIDCDIVCVECGKLNMCTITNDKDGRDALLKIVNNDNKFKIPRSIRVMKKKEGAL